MNLQDIWKDVYALARLARGEDHSFSARSPLLQKAVGIALGDSGDDLAGRKPGRITLLQHQKRLPKSYWHNHPMSTWNCRCVALPLATTSFRNQSDEV